MDNTLRIHKYGNAGTWVVALHGGPAAVGEAAPIARGLADSFHVLEPWQRGSGSEPLTVARHIADLHEVIQTYCKGTHPFLIGESWGAMLALAFAAEHPDKSGPLVLVGCGTFDENSRAKLVRTIEERTTENMRREFERIEREVANPNERLIQQVRISASIYDCNPLPDSRNNCCEPFDLQAHRETWEDMLRLQRDGVYPQAFSAINVPVLMLHGTYDPHPGRDIYNSLKPYLPQLEYMEFERCGHSPWREKTVSDEFFRVLQEWILRNV